jgi:hypothetical protein
MGRQQAGRAAPMTQLFEVSNEEKITCLKREIDLRERVYARYMAEGKMKRSKAEREIEIMKAILADYQK